MTGGIRVLNRACMLHCAYATLRAIMCLLVVYCGYFCKSCMLCPCALICLAALQGNKPEAVDEAIEVAKAYAAKILGA